MSNTGDARSGGHLLYGELASWWPLLSAPEDHAQAAALYGTILKREADPPARSLLELGSGGGNNAFHLMQTFGEVVLVDPAADMLSVSHRLNPECEHVLGDMRSLRLGREFDCVLVQDAIGYMTTLEDLRTAADTVFVHLRAGGSFLIAPDFVRESFRFGAEQGGHDGPERALRYLEWTWDPDPSDTTYTVDLAYLLRTVDGAVQAHSDRHVLGLFSVAQWLATLQGAGLVATTGRHTFPGDTTERLLFHGTKP
ncbi:MAG: class I SAM-dependent methyltransferase [Gemmatimonadota bacterium]